MLCKWIGFIVACIIAQAANDKGTIPDAVLYIGMCIMVAGYMSGREE